METEKRLAEYVADTGFQELPGHALEVIKNVVLTNLGTTIGGADAEGCREAVDLAREWGGSKESTLHVHGGKVPAHNAAFANSIMARALDFDDVMNPGIHVGASSVPTALAMAERVGGCSGKDFLAALVLGTEVAARINAASAYDGFDPVGICTVFATAAVAGRILGLNARQMLDALALALNRAGGSFQSNIDGALAVRFIQGFASQGGIISAQLAQRGITGPQNFLEGMHGYFHLYAKDKQDTELVAGELGKRFELSNTVFKKYPSSGSTMASTQAVLELVREKGIGPDDVAEVRVRVTRQAFRMGGHPFVIGDNPTVNAQFNIRYCVANAFHRKCSKLQHFEPLSIKEPQIMDLARRVHTQPDAALESRGLLAMDMEVVIRDGTVFRKSVDIPAGFPGNPLSRDEHMERFWDCVGYAQRPWPGADVDKIISLVEGLEGLDDVRSLIPLLLRAPGQTGH